MKIILKFCLISVVVFLISFIFSFIFFAAAFKIVKELKWISGIAYEWIVLILSFLIAIFFTILLIAHIIRKRSSRIENWLSLNYPQLILWYVISAIAFVSLKSKIIWSVQDLREIISLQWMIFGIATTIFLVWNVLIIKHLKEKVAFKEEVTNLLEKKRFFENKFHLFQQASNRFNIAKLVAINLIILLITTAIIYIMRLMKKMQNMHTFMIRT